MIDVRKGRDLGETDQGTSYVPGRMREVRCGGIPGSVKPAVKKVGIWHL